ncbi:MAG: cyclic nucleotide-binding domain-containing protein [Pseudomonadales bacterium]|nr:cyclic nucleotide-binding domain-containing protein [Pseudomonadales bacterium]
MKTISLKKIDPSSLDQYLNQIPFFSDLMHEDRQQFELLLKQSKLMQYQAGETVITQDDEDQSLYFLLKGSLTVFSDASRSSQIATLSSGQVFGALSAVNDQPRSATLICDPQEASMVLALDASIFTELYDFSSFKLKTKASLLRIVVNNTRWKLEVARRQQTDHPLAKQLDKLKPFSGMKNTEGELNHLADQAFMLGQLLEDWNKHGLSSTPSSTFSSTSEQKKPSFVARLFSR